MPTKKNMFMLGGLETEVQAPPQINKQPETGEIIGIIKYDEQNCDFKITVKEEKKEEKPPK